MKTTISAQKVLEFVGHLHARRADAALNMALSLADDGVPVQEILTDLLGAAQVEVGKRWYRNDYSVADEHAATSIVDRVLTLLSVHSGRPIRGGPHVLALCPEGEWHTMPLRLTAQAFELEDIEVTFLGASLPSDHLARFLDSVHPDVVALSSSTPLSFDGVLAAVEVAHLAGIPVLAGGRALGTDDRRARALGVDMWASSAAAGVALARSANGIVLRTPDADVGAALEMALDRPHVLDGAMEALLRRVPTLATESPRQRQRARKDFDLILQVAEASVLLRDLRVFRDLLRWRRPMLQSRDVPSEVVETSLAVLREVSRGTLADLFQASSEPSLG